MTMDFSEASSGRFSLPVFEEDIEHDESALPIVKVSTLCCAVVTVHLPDIPWDSVQSVCEVRGFVQHKRVVGGPA